jgi:homoserine kinase
MFRAFDQMGGRPRGLELVCANRIPHGRGLGSSAAAIVGGLVLARALVVGGEDRLSDAELLDLAVSIEGHPDNVAACLYGGVTIAWTRDAETVAAGESRVGVLRLTPSPLISPVVCIPSTSVATKKARSLLPEHVPHADAAWNAARAGLLSIALTQRPDLLFEATADRLHQNYRRSAYPRSSDLLDKLRNAGIPAAISGAGPTVIAFASQATRGLLKDLAGARFTTDILAVDLEGARVVPLDS